LNDVIDQNSKKITNHWAQLTVFFGFLATGLGFFTLYIYTSTIGRTELFMPSIDVKSALVVWLLLTLLIMASYLIILSATTWLFGCAVSQFSNIQDDLGKITCFIFIPTVLGFATFLWMLYYKTDILNSWISILILIGATLPIYLITYKFTSFGTLVKKSQTLTRKKKRDQLRLKTVKNTVVKKAKSTKKKKTRNCRHFKRLKISIHTSRIGTFFSSLSAKTKQYVKFIETSFSEKSKITRSRRRYVFVVFSWAAIFSTVACSALPTMLTLQTYIGEETFEAVDYIAGISLGALTLTLLPVFIFYFSKGDAYRKTRNAILAIVIAFCCTAFILKGTLKQITYAAAGSLDIRQNTLSRYVINEDINLSDLNNTIWKTRSLNSKKVEIEAYPLFSFGDTLLLCPKDMLSIGYKVIRQYSKYCISTNNSKVTRKPVQPKVRNTSYCQNSAICKASEWKSWENLQHLQSKILIPFRPKT